MRAPSLGSLGLVWLNRWVRGCLNRLLCVGEETNLEDQWEVGESDTRRFHCGATQCWLAVGGDCYWGDGGGSFSGLGGGLVAVAGGQAGWRVAGNGHSAKVS